MNLYHCHAAGYWRWIRQIGGAESAALVAAGKLVAVHDDGGSFVGYVIAQGCEGDFEMLSGASSGAISPTEMKMNAGLYGRSRTWGLSEARRLARHAPFDDKKILPAEDAIERAMAKVRIWPHPASRIDDGSGEPRYGDRAVRVYPKCQ